MAFTAGVTVTVQRPGGRDADGAPLPGSHHDVAGCALAPAGSVEVVAGQETVIDSDTLYGPYGADIEATDQVDVPADQPLPEGRYDVDGRPANYKNPFTGTEGGIVVRLQRVT